MTTRVKSYETNVKPKLDKVFEYMAKGKTRNEVAKSLGISVRTLYTYMTQHDELRKVMTEATIAAAGTAESFLFKSAEGFYYEEEYLDNKGVKHTLKKYCKPSVTAQMFYLKNKDNNAWKDKQEVQQDINTNMVIFSDPGDLPD